MPSRGSPLSAASSKGPAGPISLPRMQPPPNLQMGTPVTRPGPPLPPPSQLVSPGGMSQGIRPGGSNPSRETQYMTVETSHGQMSIPMDIQGASRVADEKRKRNAGASARFRARRKEKEMAASKEIDDLKRHIGDLQEDCNFYRNERDILTAALSNSSDASRLLPRPSSPRRHRTVIDPSSQSEGTCGSPDIQRFEERGEPSESGSVSRRRLDTPPQYGSYYPSASQAVSQQEPHTTTLPPLQSVAHQAGQQLPQLRSVSYPGFAGSPAGPPSPWANTSHTLSYPQSQTHSRSHSSSRSYQSGPSA